MPAAVARGAGRARRSMSALDGVRVLDLADESAVFAARVLADLGADVIRVEPPNGGRLRGLGPFLDGKPGAERSFLHLYHNANKRSVTLAIERPAGAALLKRLAASADVVLETAPPGQMATLGVGYDDLRAMNPRLIHVSVTPFGQSGAWANRRANDLVAGAAGGLLYTTGQPDDPPVQGGADPAFKMASLAAAAGVMFALAGRDVDPRSDGAHIDISLQEAVMMATLQTANVNIYTQEGRIPGRPGISMAYECKDGKWFGMNNRADRFGALLQWARDAGIETELTEGDFERAGAGGIGAQTPISDLVTALARTQPRDAFVAKAQALDMFCLPVLRFSEMADVEHFAVNEQFLEVEHAPLGRTLGFVRSPVDALPSGVAIRRAPLLGEHNLEVYGELGLNAADVDDLRAQGVV